MAEVSRPLTLIIMLALAACSFTSPQARLADAITRAVIANDMSPVMNRLDPQIEGVLTRVRVAEFSDRLAASGQYEGVSQTHGTWCPQDDLCFDAQFQNATYHEIMQLAKDGKVRYWWIRAAKQS